MINFNSVYASVFRPDTDNDKYVKANISTSRKDQNDEYINSNWFGYFLGRAKDKAAKLNDGARIFIVSGGVTNEKFTDKNGDDKYFVSVKIFDFVILDNKEDESGGRKKSAKKSKKRSVDDEEDFLEDIDDEDEVSSKKPARKSAGKKRTKKAEDFDYDDDDGIPF